MNPDENYNNLSRLKWACRRGMLELDVLLNKFLDEAYISLPVEDKKIFVEYLNSSDPELFSWLMGKTLPDDPNLARMTGMIRRHAQTRL